MKPGALVLAVLMASGTIHAQAPASFDDCDQAVLRHPDDVNSYRCYVAIAGRQNGWAEAARRLDALVSVDPANFLAKLMLASVEARRGNERAEPLYVESITAFGNSGAADREVTARLEYATFLVFRNRAAEYGEQLELAALAATESGRALLSAWVELFRAQADYRQARYEAAENRLMEIREVIFREGIVYQKSLWYSVAGSARWGMGRFPEALQAFQQQAELLHDIDNSYEEASALSNVALLAARLETTPYGPQAKNRIVSLVEKARAAAVRGGNRVVEGKSELYLAQLTADVRKMREHLEKGLALARDTNNLQDVLLAMRLLAESLVTQEPRDPGKGMKLSEEAVRAAESTGSWQDKARSRIVQSTLYWHLLQEGTDFPVDRDQAIQLSLAALDAIEVIRDNQSGATARARTFSPWVFFYHRFIGNLLWPPQAVPSPEDTDRAFRIAERMRARVFLDELDAADAGQDLNRLPWSSLPGVVQIQERLTDHEAVLSFLTEDLSIKGFFSGGSWLTLITRNSVGVYSLPEKSDLAAAVDLAVGSIRNRDGLEQPGLERLYQDLLEIPMRDLPATIEHLIVVPAGPLHRLPFGALRQPSQGSPLGIRYRISQVPSMAAWLHWIDQEIEPAGRPVLAWIDPEIGEQDDPADQRGPVLGRLPHAIREARAARNYLGGGVQVRLAGEATEAEFKRSPFRDFAIVHLGAHAIVNDLHSDLSGILLAAGAGEDGLLQVREIVNLDLTGRTVILSACRSASGVTLEGEGVMSLARAFFVAGAGAVVANLWPVRDDEAAAFSTELYRHLGKGDDLATALVAARRDRLAAGAPAEAWAGTVLFGNGRMAPFEGGMRRPWWSRLHLPALAGLLAIFAGLRGMALQRRHSM